MPGDADSEEGGGGIRCLLAFDDQDSGRWVFIEEVEVVERPFLRGVGFELPGGIPSGEVSEAEGKDDLLFGVVFFDEAEGVEEDPALGVPVGVAFVFRVLSGKEGGDLLEGRGGCFWLEGDPIVCGFLGEGKCARRELRAISSQKLLSPFDRSFFVEA